MEPPVEVALDIAQSMGSIGRSADDRIRQDELAIFPLLGFAAAMLDTDVLLPTADGSAPLSRDEPGETADDRAAER